MTFRNFTTAALPCALLVGDTNPVVELSVADIAEFPGLVVVHADELADRRRLALPDARRAQAFEAPQTWLCFNERKMR